MLLLLLMMMMTMMMSEITSDIAASDQRTTVAAVVAGIGRLQKFIPICFIITVADKAEACFCVIRSFGE